MDYFIPSEIARLVLGYLKEEQCTKSYTLFVNECVHLREYATHLRHGREYPTTIADMTLKQILNEYGKHKQHETKLKSHTLDGMWLKHDALITQLKGRCIPSTPCAAPSSGHTAVKAQGQRFNRNRRPNAMGAVDHSRAMAVTGGRLEAENRVQVESLPGSPALTEEALDDGTQDSDSQSFALEAGQALTPSGRYRNRQEIRTLSPKSLGGILVNITQVEERCQNLNYPASYLDGSNSVTQSEAVPSTSTDTGGSQENTFTNHQRKATSDSHSNVPSVKTKSVVKPNKTESPKPRKVKYQVENSSQEEEEPVTIQEQCITNQSIVQAPNAPDSHKEPTLDCVTPRKSDPRTTAIAIGKSPRRKGPAPKRRSTCRDELTSVLQPSATNSNSSHEEGLSMPLSMPRFDDLINNLNFAEKLAQTINDVKQTAESAALNTAPAPVHNPSQPQPDPAPTPTSPKKKLPRRSARRAKKEKKPAAAASFIAEPEEVASEENVDNVLHIQDNMVTQEAVKSILEMTKSDPDFDILFHMFNSDKPIIFDEVEEPGLTQTSLPESVASTSTDYELGGELTTTMTANYQSSPQTATVLHPGMHGQPDYVETVKVSAIQEVIRTPKTQQPAAQGEADCFKVPDPPVVGKSRDTSPNAEESPALLKSKSAKGGSRKGKAKKLTVPWRRRSNSTDSSDSAGSEPGPGHVVSAPGPREVAPSPGPAYSTPSHSPAYSTPSSRPAYSAPSHSPAYSAPSHSPAYSAPSHSPAHSTPSPYFAYSTPSSHPRYIDPSHTVPSPLQLTAQVNHIMTRASQMATSTLDANQVDHMSEERVEDVISNTGELNINQFAVVDLGHIQTPATISLVTSDGTETAVASTVMPNFNIMAELTNYTPTAQTVPLYQEAASVPAEAVVQHQLPQQQLGQQQVQQEQLVQQQVQQEKSARQHIKQEQLAQQQQFQQQQIQQPSQVPQQQQNQQEQLPQQQQNQQEQVPQQQQIQQPQLPQEPLLLQQQDQQEQLTEQQEDQQPQKQIQQEQSPLQKQIQQEQLLQQQVPQEPLTEQQEAEQAASMLQSVYQLEPSVSSATSLTYSAPPCRMSTSAAPIQHQYGATPTSSLHSGIHQAATAVETQNNLHEASSKKLDPAPTMPTSSVRLPASTQLPAQSENQPSVSSTQTLRSVSRCLYADEKTPTSKAVGAGKVAGVTPLVGSPVYSNPETPTLGAQKVVGSDSPAAATLSPPKSAAPQLHMKQETPLSSKSKSVVSLAVPGSSTGKSLTKVLSHSPGSARTRYTWPRIQSRSTAKRAAAAACAAAEAEQTVSVPPAESEPKLESPTKENKTPEKVPPPQGGGTPLATKEAEVAATMVAMATTPVKDRDCPLYSYLPAGNAQAVLPPNEHQTRTQTETQIQSDSESNMLNAPRTDRVYKTPKKQRLCAQSAVSPIRSPLLKSLIQVSAGALLNGHNGTDGCTTRGSPVKRRLNSEKGKDVRHSKSKRPRFAKMDVDKFLEKVHSPSAPREVP